MSFDSIPAQWHTSLNRLGGNVQLLKELARFYLEDHGPLLRDLKLHLEARRAETAERSAHSMKGLSANFDRMELVDICAQAEQLARAGAIDEALALYPRLENEASRLAEELQYFLREGSPMPSSGADG